MAVTAATKTSDFSGFLTAQQSAPIFDKIRNISVFQSLARQVQLGISGNSIPVRTGRLTPAWVDEGAQKPASTSTMALKTISPKKIAVIVPVSEETVRANPGGFMQLVKDDVAEAFAEGFDKAAAYDQSPTGGAGGGPFATFLNQTNKTVEIGTGENIHQDFVSALRLLVNDGKKLNGFGLDSRLEPDILGATDDNGRPLYTDLTSGERAIGETQTGKLLGRRTYIGEGVYSGATEDIVGWAGDWTQAVWGVIGGINYKISDQAAVTINGVLTSLWENNLVALRAEAEYGWLVNDVNAFASLTDAS
jgi:HK97 family phage major capsid protein